MVNQEQERPVMMPGNYDPAMINRLKKEIVQDLEARQEWQEDYYDNNPNYGGRRGPAGVRYAYPPPPQYRSRRYPEVDYDWWTDREEYQYQRNQAMLKNQLRNELMALDKMNRRIGRISDPMVRQALVELLQEARQQGAGVPELIDSLNANNPGTLGTVVDRFTAPLKGIERRSFGWGVGAVLLGMLLLPSLAKSVRSITDQAMGGTTGFTGGSGNLFDMSKEDFDQLVAESPYNKAGNQTETAPKGQPPAKK